MTSIPREAFRKEGVEDDSLLEEAAARQTSDSVVSGTGTWVAASSVIALAVGAAMKLWALQIF